MLIKGIIIAIGGNEDKGNKQRKLLHAHHSQLPFITEGIIYRVLSEMKSRNAPVEIITSASSIPERVGKIYLRTFKKLGCKNVNVMHIEDSTEADKPDILERIAKAGCIMFTGGDQFKLTCILRNTELSRLINNRYMDDHLVIAGTSAGAMAMPDLMIYPGTEPINVQSKEVKLYEGLSLIHDVIIDTHFLVRGRFRRLAIATADHPAHLGIGLEEDTGIILREGSKMEAIGSGLVTILDARNIQMWNPSVKREAHEIFIENLIVHLMGNGDHFKLNKIMIT